MGHTQREATVAPDNRPKPLDIFQSYQPKNEKEAEEIAQYYMNRIGKENYYKTKGNQMNFEISKDEKGVSHLLRGPRYGLCDQLILEHSEPSTTTLVTCEECNELIQKVKGYLVK